MLTSDKKHLSIFANGIIVDLRLPKYSGSKINDKLKTEESKMNSIKEFIINNDIASLNIQLSESEKTRLSEYNVVTPEGFEPRLVTNNRAPKEQNKRVGLLDKLASLFRSKGVQVDENYKSVDEDKYSIDIPEFFTNVKTTTVDSSKKYVDRLSGYLRLLSQATASGQTALREKLLQNLIIAKYESILYSEGLYKVISESKVAEFASKSKKPLSLHYIKNYVRFIPSEVIEKKLKADELGIFDNYVILHYDPNGVAYSMTEKEKEEEDRRKRDPILFGVINNSDKLYFIADWEDELCNLKFDDLIDHFNGDKSEFLSESVTNYVG